MKIIILTFSKVNNYGANLQCYALAKVLQNLGHDVEILDYQLKRSFVKNPIYNIFSYFQSKKFERFREKNLPPFTRHFIDYDDLKKNYPQADCYIVGSDQVWNPNITKNANVMAYFFDFLPKEIKKISYAASFGIEEKDAFNNYSNIGDMLRSFDSIGVREHTGVNLCKVLSGCDASLNVDPTILYGSFDNFVIPKETNNLYTFFFCHKKEYYDVARAVARDRNYHAFILAQYKLVKEFRNIISISVDGWVNAIANSKFIITDSFHCTVFSILFNRNFIVFNMPGKSDRVTTLLKELQLEDRLCLGTDDYEKRKAQLLKPIDFSFANNKLCELRKKSMDYLMKALS